MARDNIWERLWESTEGDLVTIRLPRAIAEELLAAISAGCDYGDGMGGDGLELDMEPEDDGIPGGSDADGSMILIGGDDDEGDDDDDHDFGGDDDSDDDEDEDDDDDEDEDDDDDEEKDEAATYGQSGGSPSGMRPKTALGEKYVGFKKLAAKIGPGAAAEVGRKKYGKDRFQAAAAKGKKLG